MPAAKLRERGALLVTHWGLSGPAILRLSAWGARALHGFNYQFPLHVNWLPQLHAEAIAAELKSRQAAQPARLVVNVPVTPLPARLWEQLVLAAGIARDTRWAALSRAAQHRLVQQLIRTEFPVTGKSLNKDEFVTCGGVRLGEVNFKTMESQDLSRTVFSPANCWTLTASPAASIFRPRGRPAGWPARRWRRSEPMVCLVVR